ncbi:MAG: thioredoxin-disulfide reductase [Anaerolineae bacterium]|nr:thioredoxin-disulfide reductase [Anaerolineae bacterium]
MQEEKIVVIGSGPAGLTAALYAARAGLNPIVITGNAIGGQVAITYEVENYPGFPEGVSGPDLVESFRKQAERFGARVVQDVVTEVDFTHGSPFTVKTQQQTYLSQSVIIATGASPRRLGVPGEDAFIGRGVSYCATCDGFFFRGKDVVVVGGGDSALEEGIFLTRFADSVRIIHRRDELRAGQLLQDRAMRNEKISFVWDTVVDEIGGGNTVENVTLRNIKTGETQPLTTDGVFVFIGHLPNNSLFQGQIDMDNQGYIITDQHKQTNVTGIFAAGEIQDSIFRQVATSVGQGCSAGMAAIRWLEDQEED